MNVCCWWQSNMKYPTFQKICDKQKQKALKFSFIFFPRKFSFYFPLHKMSVALSMIFPVISTEIRHDDVTKEWCVIPTTLSDCGMDDVCFRFQQPEPDQSLNREGGRGRVLIQLSLQWNEELYANMLQNKRVLNKCIIIIIIQIRPI